MIILGIGSHNHDASASLIIDGEIVFSAAEERFDRVKHSSGFPIRAVEAALRYAGIGINQVNAIAYYMDYRKYLDWFVTERAQIGEAGEFSPDATSEKQLSDDLLYRQNLADLRLRQTREILQYSGEVVPIEHHLAHAACAYFNSGFDDAAILTIDAIGEWETTSLSVGHNSSIKKLKSIRYPHSLGTVYKAISVFLGFGENDSGKTMGLAAYGDPTVYRHVFHDWIRLLEDGKFELRHGYLKHQYVARYWSRSEKDFGDLLISAFGASRKAGEELSERDCNIAASLQERLEEAGVHLALNLQKETQQKNLCIAGGVGLNGVMNYRILCDTEFENIYVPPASGDDGASLGAAQYLAHVERGEERPRSTFTPYLGSEWTEECIKDAIDEYGGKAIYVSDPAFEAASRIAAGKVIGWFQGRSEIGPRALGNRSILADARRAEMKKVVNERIKFRESFRPFAPACLAEHASDYFEMQLPSPFMLMVPPTRPDKRQVIPSVTHVDGTARLQTVTKSNNLMFHKLLTHIYTMTGVPVVMNTSFNVRGEPIVDSPNDAIACFRKTNLDALVIGNWVLDKPEA